MQLIQTNDLYRSPIVIIAAYNAQILSHFVKTPNCLKIGLNIYIY